MIGYYVEYHENFHKYKVKEAINIDDIAILASDLLEEKQEENLNRMFLPLKIKFVDDNFPKYIRDGFDRLLIRNDKIFPVQDSDDLYEVEYIEVIKAYRDTEPASPDGLWNNLHAYKTPISWEVLSNAERWQVTYIYNYDWDTDAYDSIFLQIANLHTVWIEKNYDDFIEFVSVGFPRYNSANNIEIKLINQSDLPALDINSVMRFENELYNVIKINLDKHGYFITITLQKRVYN